MDYKITDILNDYEKISEEIKFASNSVIRLKLLSTLKYGNYSMKEINKKTKISYCSLSTNANFLEMRHWVVRESTKYRLTNEMQIYLENLLDFDKAIETIKTTDYFFNNHDISKVSRKSIEELYLLENPQIITSNLNEILKSQRIIEEVLQDAKDIKAVFPYSYSDFPVLLNKIIEKNISLEIVLHEQIYNSILEEINYQKKNFLCYLMNMEPTFLLIVTDKALILGLYFEEGGFDQQKLLISNTKNSIKWGLNLFKNFKEENYLKYSSK